MCEYHVEAGTEVERISRKKKEVQQENRGENKKLFRERKRELLNNLE